MQLCQLLGSTGSQGNVNAKCLSLRMFWGKSWHVFWNIFGQILARFLEDLITITSAYDLTTVCNPGARHARPDRCDSYERHRRAK